MSTIALHTRLAIVQLLRLPAFVVPTAALPVMFFVFFGISQAHGRIAANAVLASFAAFAVLGVVLFQFGVGIAVERDTPWERYVRTLPVRPEVRIVARLSAALAFGLPAAGLVVVVGLLTTRVSMGPGDWAGFAAVLVAGGVPFGLLGVAIGYWVPARGALPVANLVYLPLSYAGGLWALPSSLPGWARTVSPWLPTRQWHDLLVDCATGHGLARGPLLGLIAYAAAFGALAVAGYWRDEARQYR